MRLFVTDYDGTLFVDDKIFKENINILNKLKENNIKIVIATGRSYPSIKNQVDTNNIPYDYLCCADGSVIYDNKDNLINIWEMNNDIIKPYQDFYKDLNFEEIQFVYPEGYSNILKDNDSKLLGINICLNIINYTKEIVDKFVLMSKNYPNYNFLNYMHPNFSYLCIKPIGINKSSAIFYLANKLNIEKQDIYVIGDSYNDYEMIRDFHGSCINTSCNDVLKVAKNKYFSVTDYIKDILKED